MLYKKLSKFIIATTGIFTLLIAVLVINKILIGGFAFWFDPARDLISALANINKISLIGPPSGIPGLFYGPYWIWFLSLAQFFSKDPRFVTFFVATIPYLFIFPFILFRFTSVLSHSTLSIIWLLFILGFTNYFTDLWNPHPAPLFILLAIYLQYLKTNQIKTKNLIITLFAGFAAGMVMNFQLSFGIGMMFGLFIFMILEVIYMGFLKKIGLITTLKNIILIGVFTIGSIISFTPFIVFEIRHEFNQTQVLINAFTHYGAVVSQTGLTNLQIIQLFIDRVGNILHIPFVFNVILLVVGLFFVFIHLRQVKNEIKIKKIRLIFILFSILFGVLCVYLTAKNPVWTYHLIGTEIVILLFVGIMLDITKFFKYIFSFWVIILFSFFLFNQIKTSNFDPKNIYGTFAAEQEIVKKIHKESNTQEYVVFAYSPAIYIYEYSYVFELIHNKNVPYQPELNPKDKKLVFLIFPPETEIAKKEDFINYRTPPVKYKTDKEIMQKDGAQIVKRIMF